jgi:hypothetical protein
VIVNRVPAGHAVGHGLRGRLCLGPDAALHDAGIPHQHIGGAADALIEVDHASARIDLDRIAAVGMNGTEHDIVGFPDPVAKQRAGHLGTDPGRDRLAPEQRGMDVCGAAREMNPRERRQRAAQRGKVVALSTDIPVPNGVRPSTVPNIAGRLPITCCGRNSIRSGSASMVSASPRQMAAINGPNGLVGMAHCPPCVPARRRNAPPRAPAMHANAIAVSLLRSIRILMIAARVFLRR